MASLTGQQIDQTYQGLIKTSANTAVSFPPASLEDGAGNTIGIKLGDGTGIGAGLITQIEGNPGVPGDPSVSVDGNGVNIQKVIAIAANGGTATITGGTGGQFDIFDGTFNFGAGFPGAPATTVDFTNATVTGLPGGAGLESGTGTDSMQSAASLTTNAASATGAQTIAIGEGAVAPNTNDINIGDSNTIAVKSILPGDLVIGRDNASSTVNGGSNILIGESNAVTQNEQNIAIGRNNTVSRGNINIFGQNNSASSQYGSTVMGSGNTSTTESGLVVGIQNTHTQKWTTCVGYNNTGGNRESVTVGSGIAQGSYRGIAIGYDADTGGGFGNVNIGIESGTDLGTGSFKVALGYRASSEADSAVAIGANVTATFANATTVNQLAIANYANLNYADDTAAAAGGIPLGGVYHNSGALRIRIA